MRSTESIPEQWASDIRAGDGRQCFLVSLILAILSRFEAQVVAALVGETYHQFPESVLPVGLNLSLRNPFLYKQDRIDIRLHQLSCGDVSCMVRVAMPVEAS